MDRLHKILILCLVVLSVSLGWEVYAIPAPSIGATVEPGMQWTCSFTFYKDGTTYLAWNGIGGGNTYSGTTFQTVFQSALGTVSAAGGGSLCFARGVYTVTGNLFNVAPNNIILDGQGDGATLQLVAGTAQPIVNVGPVINFTIANLVFDGNSANEVDPASRGAGELVVLTNTGNQHISILNMVCKNTRSGACLDLGGNDIVVEGSEFINNGVVGAAFTTDHLHIGTGATSVKIVGNYFNTCTDTGIALDGVNGATVTGNTLVDCGNQLLTEAFSARDIAISGNHFEQKNFAVPMITIDHFAGAYPSSNDTTISGNTFYNVQAATYNCLTVNGYFRVTIANNVFWCHSSSVNRYAINVFNAAGGTGLNILGNTFALITGGAKGILIENSSDIQISSNYFKTSNTGIEFAGVASSNAIINGNSFQGIVAPILYTTTPTSVLVTSNMGYNPQATSAVTAGTSIWTFTDNDFYPELMYLKTIAGITAWTCNGTSGWAITAGSTCQLYPAQTMTVTWTTTAPVFQKEPQ